MNPDTKQWAAVLRERARRPNDPPHVEAWLLNAVADDLDVLLEVVEAARREHSTDDDGPQTRRCGCQVCKALDALDDREPGCGMSLADHNIGRCYCGEGPFPKRRPDGSEAGE